MSDRINFKENCTNNSRFAPCRRDPMSLYVTCAVIHRIILLNGLIVLLLVLVG